MKMFRKRIAIPLIVFSTLFGTSSVIAMDLISIDDVSHFTIENMYDLGVPEQDKVEAHSYCLLIGGGFDVQGTVDDLNEKIASGDPDIKGILEAMREYGCLKSAPEKAKPESKTENALFYYSRGNGNAKTRDYSGAIADYNKAIEINPRYAEAYNNRGLAKHKLKDYDGAISDFSKAIEINPRYGDAYTNRGLAKDKLGDKKGATVDYNKAVEILRQGIGMQ